MTGRPNALGSGGAGMPFHSNSSADARNCFETHCYFNMLTLRALDDLLFGELNTCELF